MAQPMMHLLIANKIYKEKCILINSYEDFLLGSIAPDAVHMRENYTREIKDEKVVFLFQLEDGIKRYEVYDFKNDEVLALCEKLCECKMESLEKMLSENWYYKKVMEGKAKGESI